MIAFSINLPTDVQMQITSFSAQYSMDAMVASAVAQVVSGGKQFNPNGSLVVTPFGIGVMGVSKSVATALNLDATQQVQNIQAGIILLASLLNTFSGNYPFALAAYITSADTVEQFDGVPPLAQVRDFVYNVSRIAANAGSVSVSGLIALSNSSSLDPNGASSKSGQRVQPGVPGQQISPLAHGTTNFTNQNSLEPILQVPDNTLSNKAWYADTGLITGNPSIRASVQPVRFMVYLDRNDPTNFLHNPSDNSMIEIQLNTSLSSFEIGSKHVYNRTPSRTGMHITLWGMEPDLISGQGTTGVFMNQFGITDYMSTAGLNQDVLTLLSTGFQKTFEPNFNPFQTNTTTVQPQKVNPGTKSEARNFTTSQQAGFNILTTGDDQQSTGQVFSTAITGDQQTLNTVAGQAIARLHLQNPSEAFRVAAQDAFIELLKLFQMNGNVWYHSKAYASGTNLGTIGGTEQVSPTAWSTKTGATSFSQHSRNNDVMTRGYVAMNYRNNFYLGYFKSLSWTQDAENPFQWKFNFTFQVEKTYTSLYTAQFSIPGNPPPALPLAVPAPPPPKG